MSHPVVWRPKTFFYPIGNTPATSFTEYLPPDVDATILALGCGDPRSALYTIHSDAKFPFGRSLDFTFCDTEPAVLARNVLIFTLLHDNCDDKTIHHVWKIWFDVFIEQSSFEIVASHCAKLVDVSSTLDGWNSSPYGAFVKFCTLDTMLQLRRYWKLYIQADAEKATVQRDMKQMYAKKIGNGLVLSSARSAGVMALEMTKLAHVHFKSYWDTGVTGADPSEARKSTHVNPTLLYSSSGDTFNLHYGTDPMACFHLAPAFLPIQGEKRMPATMVMDLLPVMKAQFAQWCRSFNARTKVVTLRFFVGDGLALCKALQHDTPEYADPWRAATVTFTEDRPPAAFNVIDTSNLSDHLGALNVLLATVPLLKREAGAALFTHSMISTKESDGHVSALHKIGVDLPLLSLVFGVVPERVSSEFTSQSIAQEMLMSSLNDSYQLLEFNVWRLSAPRTPGKGYTFTCDPAELANALFASYLKLFLDESIGGLRRGTIAVLKHNTRDTYATFLAFVKNAFSGDWNAVMDLVEDKIGTDTSLFIGTNSYQDLCRALHFTGVMDIVPNPQRFRASARDYCYQGWNDIPKAVCVVMTVPRSKFQALLLDEHASPLVHCQITGPAGNNMFWSIQASFGRLEEVNPGPDRKLVIHEDEVGWQGTSDLIIHFVAPAWTFVEWGASQYKLAFHMYGPHAMQTFKQKLGLELCIFRTTLADKQHTFIVKERPLLASEVASSPPSSASTIVTYTIPGVTERQTVTLKFKGTEPTSFVARCPVVDEESKAVLADKATQVESKPASVSSVRISFKGFDSVLSFPYPVNTNGLVTRIARKSSFVEVEGRISNAVKIPAELDPFPVALTDRNVAQLSMHHVSLDSLPALRNPIPPKLSDCGWLERHLQFALTEEKREAQIPGRSNPPLWDLKESIYNFFLFMLKTNKGKPTVFQLSDTGKLGVHTIIFVSAIRIDLTAHTFVADACVLPLSRELVVQKPFQKALMELNDTVQSVRTTTTDEEVPLWKAFLPTAVERCRRWKHREGEECEYVKEGKIPLSLEIAKDPLCGCGRGQNLGGFEDVKEWAAFKSYVTRAAIGLPFSTSLLGGIAAEIKNAGRSTPAAGASTPSSADGCAACGQPGKPKLLLCARCKATKYCSPACQKADWKRHKKTCAA